MTRLRHTNLVNALFYLPRPAVVLVPLLLKGLTLIDRGRLRTECCGDSPFPGSR